MLAGEIKVNFWIIHARTATKQIYTKPNPFVLRMAETSKRNVKTTWKDMLKLGCVVNQSILVLNDALEHNEGWTTQLKFTVLLSCLISPALHKWNCKTKLTRRTLNSISRVCTCCLGKQILPNRMHSFVHNSNSFRGEMPTIQALLHLFCWSEPVTLNSLLAKNCFFCGEEA